MATKNKKQVCYEILHDLILENNVIVYDMQGNLRHEIADMRMNGTAIELVINSVIEGQIPDSVSNSIKMLLNLMNDRNQARIKSLIEDLLK